MIAHAPRNVAWRQLVRRNSRLGRLLTLVLPVVAVATIGGLIYGWEQPGGRIVPVDGKAPADPVASDVTYDDRDDLGRRFSITADSASPIGGDDRHISLKKPLADMTMSGGAYVALAANESILDRDTGLMALSGDVTLLNIACSRLGVRSVSGSVEYSGTLAKSGRYDINSHSGDVRLTLGSDVGFELSANSFSGSVSYTHLTLPTIYSV